MVPVLVLVLVAFGFIKALMTVVARDEAADLKMVSDYSSPYGYDPTVEVRARVHDDARAFLMPAAAETAVEPIASEPADLGAIDSGVIDAGAS